MDFKNLIEDKRSKNNLFLKFNRIYNEKSDKNNLNILKNVKNLNPYKLLAF